MKELQELSGLPAWLLEHDAQSNNERQNSWIHIKLLSVKQKLYESHFEKF